MEAKVDTSTHYPRTLWLTIVGLAGIRATYRFIYPRLFVAVKIGKQQYETTLSGRAKSVEWNWMFEFTVDEPVSDDLELVLYRQKRNGKRILLDRIAESLKPSHHTQESTRDFPSTKVAISFRISWSPPMISTPEHIFALIIGINEYKSYKFPDLKGAVSDADLMVSFLSSLKVPERNVCVLKNEQATRQNIISTFFDHLINNPAIEKGDTIIFYYAGHGGRVNAPTGWETESGKVETLCPHDEWIPDARGQQTPGIPDRTVDGILRKLARIKGNNITVILDCCHSGGIARPTIEIVPEDKHRERPADSCPITDPQLDQEIWDEPEQPGALTIDDASMSPYVLLAACKEGEVAYETTEGDSHGAFTKALISNLYRVPLKRITYEALIESLPPLSYHQVPQCVGRNKNRILFTISRLSKFLPVEKLVAIFLAVNKWHRRVVKRRKVAELVD